MINVIQIDIRPQMMRMGKKKASDMKLIQNDRGNFFFKMINSGYFVFRIVKNFTTKMLWNGSCLAFMFLMPMMFEVLCEQEAVLDKIQRDDMIAQAADMAGPAAAMAEGGGAIVRPF